MDTSRQDNKELAALVTELRIEVAKLQAVCPQITSVAATQQAQGEIVAGLVSWRESHEKADEARSRRYAAWAGLLGALLMKVIDWAHTHLPLFGAAAGR